MSTVPSALPALRQARARRVDDARDDSGLSPLPTRAAKYPEFRYMGSKRRLLPWIHGVLSGLDFETAADPFVGSACVAYLMKCMGRRVIASDFLNFPATLATATVRNDRRRLDAATVGRLLSPARKEKTFIQDTFRGIFYSPADLRFLDRISANIEKLAHPADQAVARAALIRSCLKKQPRGVFTFAGRRYDDGRRDLHISIEQHFLEQVPVFNGLVFDNGYRHMASRVDVFEQRPRGVDLVYLDPPYVPRADDNCYVKRYHFLEGLSCYWDGLEIMENTKVRKIKKLYTPFSYRRTALEGFDRLFQIYRKCTIVLSYSSNGYPDRNQLERLLMRYKRHLDVYEKPHRYHFGTHNGVVRSEVKEYLLVARGCR